MLIIGLTIDSRNVMPSIAGVDYRVDYCHLEVGISCQVYQVLIIG